MVWEQQCQRNLRIFLFGLNNRIGSEPIKPAVTANNKICYAMFHNVVFYCNLYGRQEYFRCFAMSYEETAFHKHPLLFLLLFIVKIIR